MWAEVSTLDMPVHILIVPDSPPRRNMLRVARVVAPLKIEVSGGAGSELTGCGGDVMFCTHCCHTHTTIAFAMLSVVGVTSWEECSTGCIEHASTWNRPRVEAWQCTSWPAQPLSCAVNIVSCCCWSKSTRWSASLSLQRQEQRAGWVSRWVRSACQGAWRRRNAWRDGKGTSNGSTTGRLSRKSVSSVTAGFCWLIICLHTRNCLKPSQRSTSASSSNTVALTTGSSPPSPSCPPSAPSSPSSPWAQCTLPSPPP
mmetsp:Transcript_38659/g.87828  ORF Transcript_38659/g.87828 Transcript_38659/m.87828 type:complete len:256 (-) Transcript_38659:652-1419(-)